MKEIVIPKENAVFWMDARGNWRNVHGRFHNKKIIDHFNASIRRDADGFYVTQVNGDILEKVYFKYEETAFFADEIQQDGETVLLILNTGQRVAVEPENLFIRNDLLYYCHDKNLIKFSERALMKMGNLMDEKDGQYIIRTGEKEHIIRERTDSANIT